MSNKFPCHPSRWGLLTSVLLLLSSVLPLASNVGMLALRDDLLAQVDFAPGNYPFYAALAAGEGTKHIAQDNANLVG